MTVDFNYDFFLSIEERNGTKKIGSEIEPIKIGHTAKDDVWDNGPTTYCRTDHHEWWLIIQNNKPYLIEKYYQTGDWSEKKETGWAAYSCPNLPSGIGIERRPIFLCQECGTDENVSFAPDPYQEELHGDVSPVYLCDSCREKSAEEI